MNLRDLAQRLDDLLADGYDPEAPVVMSVGDGTARPAEIKEVVASNYTFSAIVYLSEVTSEGRGG